MKVEDERPDCDPGWVDRVRRALVVWYEQGHRKLPWREEHDPYRILVSEMMLVQTTVAAVVPYFHRFLEQFPTVEALARADEEEVLKAWEGLGYYRRARQLHAASRMIVEEHGGRIPNQAEDIRALPGVGRYIAGAVLSFAFDQPAPIVEANTQRVLTRWLAWTDPLEKSRTQKRLWEAAERLVPEIGAGTFNQAFMELGATVCLPRQPLCLLCPVVELCRAQQLGLQEKLPLRTPKAPPREVAEACALVVRGDRLLMVRRGPGRLWEGFWEFPTVHLDGADPAGRDFPDEKVELAEGVQRLTGVSVQVGELLKAVRFGVTTHRVQLTAHASTDLGGEPSPGPGLVEAGWWTREAIEALTLGSASRRLARWASQPTQWRRLTNQARVVSSHPEPT